MTHRIDDRRYLSDNQRKLYSVLITATDRVMSRWGKSKFAWACLPEDAQTVFNWVKGRTDMQYVSIARNDWYPRAAHVHIYVVTEDHPSLH